MGVPLDVDTVSMAALGAALLMVTVEGLKVQLGVGLPPPVTLHDRLTLPVYPLTGVTVTVDVALLPGVNKLGFNGEALST